MARWVLFRERGSVTYEDWDCGLHVRDVGGDVRRCDSAAACGDLLRRVERPGMAGSGMGRFVGFSWWGGGWFGIYVIRMGWWGVFVMREEMNGCWVDYCFGMYAVY